MKQEYIDPFIESVVDMMQTMLDVTPENMPPTLKNEALTFGDISGIVGFASDAITGAVAMSFPQETALLAYEKMMGEAAESINSDVQDTVGEMANMVAGGAKTILSQRGLSFLISIPTIVVGQNHSLAYKQGIPIIVIQFKMDGLPFCVEISMKVEEQQL